MILDLQFGVGKTLGAGKRIGMTGVGDLEGKFLYFAVNLRPILLHIGLYIWDLGSRYLSI